MDDIGDGLDLDRMDNEKEAAQKAHRKRDGGIRFLKERKTESEPEEPVEEKARADMNEQVGQMVIEWVQPSQIIVESKRGVGKCPKASQMSKAKELYP